MAYNDSIPLATDALSQSQSEIKDNFTELKIVIDKDHETFGAGNQGEHKQTTLTDHTPAAPGVNKVRLYSNTGELCLKKGAAGAEIDFTTITDVAGKGHTKLASGLLINWGNVALTGLTVNHTFDQAYAGTPYQVIHTLSIDGNNASDAKDTTAIGTWNTTTVTFTRGRASQNATVRYIAIGV